MKYEIVDAEKAFFPIKLMCECLSISRSAYYEHACGEPSERARADRALTVHIRALFGTHRRRYGSPRIHCELRAAGMRVSRKRVAKIMHAERLVARAARRYVVTTDSKGTHAPAPNLLQRDFVPSRPNLVWVTDVTYLPSKLGWLYLAAMIDLGSRKIIGWSISDSNDTALILEALRRALALREHAPAIHHSDRGSPYASWEYQDVLSTNGIKASMSKKGDCWDNAVAESFFATLKNEIDIPRGGFDDAAHATRAVAEYIDGYYNRVRRHSTLDYASPTEYERFAS